MEGAEHCGSKSARLVEDFYRVPAKLASGYWVNLIKTGDLNVVWVFAMLVMAVAVITFIVFMERAQRRLVVQFPKRQVGLRMTSGEMSHLPLKLNSSGVIPPIFASSLLALPATVASFNSVNGPEWLQTVSIWLTPASLLPVSGARQCTGKLSHPTAQSRANYR